jgi:hypothetical protein
MIVIRDELPALNGLLAQLKINPQKMTTPSICTTVVQRHVYRVQLMRKLHGRRNGRYRTFNAQTMFHLRLVS